MSVGRGDPGGVFASDAHRRVLAGLSDEATPVEALVGRYADDLGLPEISDVGDSSVQEVTEVLEDLKADGYVSDAGGGWRMLKKGLDTLTGPIANEPPALSEAAVAQVEEQNRLHNLRTEARAAAGRIENAQAEIDNLTERLDADEQLIKDADDEGVDYADD